MASNETSSASEIQGEEITARPYQLELLDAALNEDTIVNLGTGAGKTFIAIMLIKELSHDILRPFAESGAKRTFFLVTTVPLVKQQATHIEVHSCLRVGQYTGDMGVDRWDDKRWHTELDQHQVLVMTMTIFKNLLLHNYIKLSQVNLLIFDECHHAVKNHDYVQIMRLFQPYIEAGGDSIPRRLGLTASLIPSKCKPGDIERKIRDLEEILVCRSQTAEDLQQVARYATNPDEMTCFYPQSSCSEEAKLLQDSLQFLQLMKKKESESEFYEQVKLYLDDCLHILINLGVWCANQFAVEGLHVLETAIKETGVLFASEWDRALLHMGWTQLKLFTEKCSIMVDQYKGQGDHTPLTPKVQELFNHLGRSKASNMSSKKDLCGIVFVERRTTAAILTKLIQRKSKSGGELGHIRCDYVVGHNEGKRGTHLRREAHMKTNKQSLVLTKFRSGGINLLVATSVVEEGVDVPKCNSVIRFDFPPNFRSYIQSKGRARAKVSKYVLLVENGEERGRRLAELSDYHTLEKELQSICRGRSVPGEEDILERMAEVVLPYRPYGKEGAVAMLGTSLSLIHRYCQKLPKDKFTILTPVFVTKKRPASEISDLKKEVQETAKEFVYCSSVQLPMNCPLKESITGVWMPTKRIADKSAALEAIKKLHKVGELNERLLPISKMVDLSDDDDNDEPASKERKRKNAGTTRRADYYPNKVAPVMSQCLPGRTHNHLYIVMMHEENKPLQLYQSKCDDPEPTALGILVSKPLPHVLIPEFYLYDSNKTLCVKLEHYHQLVNFLSSELSLLKDSHEAIFSELLRIRGSWIHADWNHTPKNYLIVPLKVMPCLYPVEVYVDMEQASTLAAMKHGREGARVIWPCPIHIFTNTIVETVHKPHTEQQLYQVVNVDSSVTPHSPFPDQAAATTYASYFLNKYNFRFSSGDQPALIVKGFGLGESRLRLLVSRFKNHEGDELKRKDQNREIILFPELCKVYPICSGLWNLVRCLPSVLWRLECLTLVDTLRSEVTQTTDIGSSEHSSLLLTHTNLRGYEDYGYGDLETQQVSFSEEGEAKVSYPKSSGSELRGPDNALLLQALTSKGAKDSINLERLETLGDSFLKLSTSVFLFCDRPIDHEGKLTTSRARRVENFNLFQLAKQRDITSLVFSTAFEPRQMWLPPGFTFQEDYSSHPTGTENENGNGTGTDQLTERDHHYNYHRVTDKGVADCVESLIGAYLVSGGIEAAIRFLKWVGIKLQCQQNPGSTASDRPDSMEVGEIASSSSYSAPPTSKRPRLDDSLFLLGSSSVFAAHFGVPRPHPLTNKQELEVERLLQLCGASIIENRLNWKFEDRKLLLQALTHASYTRNRVTDCYQRLEFLGDAALDYLVTCHIYSSFPRYGPGDISNMRAALVNNVTFAELSVKLGLQRSFLHSSPSLFKQIQDYIHIVNRDRNCDNELVDNSEIYCSVREAAPTLEHCGEEPIEGNPSIREGKACEGGMGNDIDELDPPKVLGDLLESLAGAIFIDSGMSLSCVWRVFQPHFHEKIASFKETIPVPPLQQLLDVAPGAKVKSDSERNRSGRYTCTVTVEDRGIKMIAQANNQKTAKAAAARAALRKLSQC